MEQRKLTLPDRARIKRIERIKSRKIDPQNREPP
jgi:hypothetical protein